MALDDQIIGVSIPDVSLGQNSKDHPRSIAINQAASLKNVVLERGLRKKRTGTTLTGGIGDANRITGLHPFLPTGGTPVLLRTQGTKLEEYTGSGDFTEVPREADEVTATISVGDEPERQMAITPNGDFLYVPNGGDNTVSVIQTSDNTVIATVSVGTNPLRCAVTPNGLFVYVTNVGLANVSKIQVSDNTVVATIPVGLFPSGCKVTPNGLFVYVANFVDGTVSKIATSTDTVVATITVGSLPDGLVITPNGLEVYVNNSNAATVSVIQTSSDTVSNTITVGTTPLSSDVTPNGLFVYVANSDSDNVSKISTASKTVVATITVGDSPNGVAVTPSGNHVHVTNNGTGDNVSKIATATDVIIQTINVGVDPKGVTVAPDGLTVYVSNFGSDTVSVLEGAGFTSDLITNFVVARDLAFLLNGVDNVHTYDGSILTDEGDTNTDPAKGSIGEYMQTRLFIVGQNSSTVFFSEPLLPQTFDRSVNQFEFVTGDNAKITAIKRATNRELLTWKEFSIHTLILAGAAPGTDWFIEDIDHEFGAVAGRSVQQAGSDWFFLSESGVRSLFRTEVDKPRAASLPVSDPIEDFMERINPAAIDLCAAVVYKNKYFLSVPLDTSTQNNAIFVYDIITRGWVENTTWLPAVWAVMNFGGVQGRQLFWGNSAASARVFEAEDGTFDDDGVAICFEEEGARHVFRLNSNEKRFRHVEVQAVATGDSELQVLAQIDAGGFVLLGTLNLLGDVPQLPIELPFPLGGNAVVKKKFSVEALGKGRDLQIRLVHDTLNEGVEILSVEAFTHVDDYKYNPEAP